MDNPRIIHAPMNRRRYAETSPITQYDYGYLLLPEGVELPTTYEIDFSNNEHKGTSIPVYGGAEGAEVPEELIRTGKDVYAFYYHVGDGFGKTEFTWRLPNKCRPSRDGQTPTPTQQSSIDQLIVRSNEAVESAEQSASAAGQSAQSAKEDADRSERAKNDAETAQRKAEEAQESAERAKDDAQTSERNASESERKAKGYADTASEKADAIHSMTASAHTLPAGSSASASYDAETGVMSFGIPKGKDGTNGDDGYSPTASVTKSGKVATITITDKNGTTSAQLSDGEDGATGATPNLTIGTVETLEPTESATATITGTPENPVLNLGIPQGKQGEVTTEEFLKAFVTDTASGAIASFPDGADGLPLKSLVVDIDPVQDLHGQDAPYPAGGGKNKVDAATLYADFANGDGTYTGATLGSPNITTVKIPLGSYLGQAVTFSLTVTAKTGETTVWFIRGVINGVGTASNAHNRVLAADTLPLRIYENFIPETVDDYLTLSYGSNTGTITIKDIQLEIGSSMTDYSPYENICPISGWTGMQLNANGTVIPISWQTEAGTVYGGKLDVLTGKLTVYPYYASYNGETLTGEWISDRDVYAVGTTPTIGAQVVNIGAQGVTVQLEPHEVESLYGVNNIFADTGDAEVEYRADTRLYIKRLTDSDTDMIADANIVGGQYFMVGNDLYKATVNIASGAQVIEGTNATKVSLSKALNQIKEA